MTLANSFAAILAYSCWLSPSENRKKNMKKNNRFEMDGKKRLGRNVSATLLTNYCRPDKRKLLTQPPFESRPDTCCLRMWIAKQKKTNKARFAVYFHVQLEWAYLRVASYPWATYQLFTKQRTKRFWWETEVYVVFAGAEPLLFIQRAFFKYDNWRIED